MNNKEKVFIFKKCLIHYVKAHEIRLNNPYMCLEELGKARALKEIIEKFIDIQATKYYKVYALIVKIDNTYF